MNTEDAQDATILEALNDTRFMARTIKGLVMATNMEAECIVQRLQDSPKLAKTVKIYPRKTKNGKILLTTRSKFSKYAPFKDKFIDGFATRRVHLENGY